MFRSRSRERFIFSSRKRKRHPQFSWLWAIVSLILSVLVAELLTRIAIDISGKRGEFAQARTGSDSIEAYQLKFVNQQLEPYKTLETEGSLLAKRSLAVGYQLVENQKHQYWEINEQGFRDREPVPVTKPKNEIRIFILGGSTAFGYGNLSNEATIGEQLEARLQQRLKQQQSSPQLYKPDILPQDEEKLKSALAKPSKIKQGQYRVINTAVPGYTSGNELAQLALQILNYKPDLVIVLNGYPDLMLPSSKKATEIPQIEAYLDNTPTNFKAYLSQVIQPLESKSYLAQIVQEHWLNPKQSALKTNFIPNELPQNLAQYLPADEAELQQRVDRYTQHHQQILRLAVGAKIPLIVAIQPEITGRNPSQLTPEEGAIATQLGREYIRKVKDSYPHFIAASQKLAKAFPHNIKAVNLYQLSDKYPSPTFIDAIHLNEEANKQVAEQLYYAISSFPKMQVVSKKPPKPKVEIKNEERS